jgi:cell division protein FtsB
LVSPGSGLAFTVGIWRPAIVLPEAVCRPERETMLRHLVLHELAHVRQRDSLGRLLFNLAFPFLYFHPLYWLLRNGVALAAEMIADDEAAGRAAKDSYVDALVALARERQPRRLVALSSHGLFGSSSQFYRRMRMLLVRKTRLASRCSWRWRLVSIAVGVVVVAVLAATVGVAPAAAQKPEPSQSATAGQASLPTAQDVQALDALRQERDELKRQIDRLQAELKAMQLREAELQKARSTPLQPQQPREELLERKGFLAPSQAAAPGATSPATTRAPVQPTPARPAARELTPEVKRIVETMPDGTQREMLVPWLRTTGAVDMEVAAGRATSDGSQLDLISLANSYTDAVTNVKIASVEHARLQQLRKSAAVSEQEAEIAAIKLEAAQRKVDLLRSIAQTALKTAEAELRVLVEWHKTGRQVAGAGPIELQVRRAEGRLEILVRIVQQ